MSAVGETVEKVKQYFWNILVWADQGINVILFGGSPDETISSRIGRNQHIWICRFAQKVLDFLLGKNHCKDSIEPEYARQKEL